LINRFRLITASLDEPNYGKYGFKIVDTFKEDNLIFIATSLDISPYVMNRLIESLNNYDFTLNSKQEAIEL
jgi:hypothetical protein